MSGWDRETEERKGGRGRGEGASEGNSERTTGAYFAAPLAGAFHFRRFKDRATCLNREVGAYFPSPALTSRGQVHVYARVRAHANERPLALLRRAYIPMCVIATHTCECPPDRWTKASEISRPKDSQRTRLRAECFSVDAQYRHILHCRLGITVYSFGHAERFHLNINASVSNVG